VTKAIEARQNKKMNSFLTLFLPIFVAFASESPEIVPASSASAPAGQQISGVVRIIRAHPETEVFFKDLKNSVIIHRDSKHNQFYEACEESRKKGTAVRLTIDPVSRRVLGITNKKLDSSNPLIDPARPLDAEKSDAGSK